MIVRRPGPRRARIASALAALTLAAPLALAPTGDALAASGPVAVTIEDVRWSGDRVTLTGHVTNTSVTPLTDVQVRLWRSGEALTSFDAVQGAIAATETPWGTSASVSPSGTDALTAASPLTTGELAPFEVSGTASELGLATADASWWVGVDVTGRTPGTRSRTLGGGRTLSTRSAAPVPVATVTELSARPRQVKENLFVDDTLAQDLTDRLLPLVRVAQERRTNWVADPALVTELRDMADGYRVRTAQGTTEGGGSEVARAWLATYDALDPALGSLAAFGTPDAGSALTLGDTDVLDRAVAAARASDGRGLPVTVAIARPDQFAFPALGQRPVRLVSFDQRTPAVHATASGSPVLLAARPMPSFTASALLADTDANRRAVEQALTRARGGGIRWIRDTTDADRAAELPAGSRAADLAEVVALPPAPFDPPARTPPDAAVTPSSLRSLRALTDRVARYTAVAPSAGESSLVDQVGSRAASVLWRDAPAERDAWVAAVEERFAVGASPAVRVDAAARVSLTGTTSEFPVTVTNTLRDPVRVRLVATSDTPQRIAVTAPDAVTVQPGTSSTVILQAQAHGSGVATTTLHAETQDGRRLTDDQVVVVSTSNAGTIGWVLVITSGIVLVVSTALRIRQVRARQRNIGQTQEQP